MRNTSDPVRPRPASGRTTTSLPPALAEIAAGRDHIRTTEFAKAVSKAHQTIRKLHCLSGQCFGIKPVRVGKHLLWPVADIAALLNGETPSSTRSPTRRARRTGKRPETA
jgi:hypothetical protein